MKDNKAIRYNKYFGISVEAFESLGVFNAFVDLDSAFHIDPLLLRECSIPEFQNAYEAFLDYFRAFVPLVKHVQRLDSSDRFFSQMIKRFTFPELQYTGLGFSKGNARGTGISGKLSVQLATSAYEIITAGYEDPEIFALMPLIEENIGQDRISDMTIAILRRQFLAYTQRISEELGVEVRRYRLTYEEEYFVPFIGNNTIHFIPKVFLNDLFVATSYEDIRDAADYNNRLKAKLAEIIGITWRECEKFTKEDWKRIILSDGACYKAAIDYYKSIRGVSYNFEDDRHCKCLDLKFAKLASDNPIQFLSKIFRSPEERVFEWTVAICEKYRHLIEDNRMSELVHRCKRRPDEIDWQLLLYMVADSYSDGAKINLDISRENNPGNGEVDFKFSKGSAKTIVEIKRSGNNDILHGYRVQLSAYMRAEHTEYGLFVVIIDDPSHEEDVKKRIEDVKEDMRNQGEPIYPIIYIKGYSQSSASKHGYKL